MYPLEAMEYRQFQNDLKPFFSKNVFSINGEIILKNTQVKLLGYNEYLNNLYSVGRLQT